MFAFFIHRYTLSEHHSVDHGAGGAPSASPSWPCMDLRSAVRYMCSHRPHSLHACPKSNALGGLYIPQASHRPTYLTKNGFTITYAVHVLTDRLYESMSMSNVVARWRLELNACVHVAGGGSPYSWDTTSRGW
jgi:hypothetical protein